jgi:hypothetical protein
MYFDVNGEEVAARLLQFTCEGIKSRFSDSIIIISASEIS